MATIAENLQIIKDSTEAIKQAIIDKGGTIEGDITTWADAISGIETGGGGSGLLTFTLNNFVFFFQDGMTWGDYINITNPNNSYEYDHVYKRSYDQYVHIFTVSVLNLNGSYVYLTDKILPQVYGTQQPPVSGGGDD